MEAIADLGDGRALCSLLVQLKPSPTEQVLCDHLRVENGKITRIENVFDVSKLPSMT